MKILIKELAKSQWQVRLDQHAVTFRSEAEARAFTRTLEARKPRSEAGVSRLHAAGGGRESGEEPGCGLRGYA